MTAEILKLINQLSQALDDSGETSTGEQIKNDATEDNMNFPLGENEDSRIQDHENRLADKIGDEVGNRVKEELKINRQATGLHSKTTNMLKDTNSILADVLKVNERVASLSQKNTNLLNRIEKYSKPAPRKIERFEKQQPTIKVQAPVTTEAQRLTPKAKAKSDMDMMKMLLAGGVLAAILAKALQMPGIIKTLEDLLPDGFKLDFFKNLGTGNIKDMKDHQLGVAKMIYKSLLSAGKVAAKAFYSASGLKTAVGIGKTLTAPVVKAVTSTGKALVSPVVKGKPPKFTPPIPDGKLPKTTVKVGANNVSKGSSLRGMATGGAANSGKNIGAALIGDAVKDANRAANAAMAATSDPKLARQIYESTLRAGLDSAQVAAAKLAGLMPKSESRLMQNAMKGLRSKMLAKIAQKKGLRATLGKIPVVSTLTGAWFGAERFSRGDYAGAALEATSAGVAFIPKAGTAASFAVDAGIIARDLSMMDENLKKRMDEVSQQNKEYQEFMSKFLSMGGKDGIKREDITEQLGKEFLRSQEGDVEMYEKVERALDIMTDGDNWGEKQAGKRMLMDLMNDERTRIIEQQSGNAELAKQFAEQYRGYVSDQHLQELENNAFAAYNATSDVMQSKQVAQMNRESFLAEIEAAFDASRQAAGDLSMMAADGFTEVSEGEYKRAETSAAYSNLLKSGFGQALFKRLGIVDPEKREKHQLDKFQAFMDKYYEEELLPFTDNINDENEEELNQLIKQITQTDSTSMVMQGVAGEFIAGQTSRYKDVFDEEGNVVKTVRDENAPGIMMIDGKPYHIDTLADMYRSGQGVSEDVLKAFQSIRNRAARKDPAARALLSALRLDKDDELRSALYREDHESMVMNEDVLKQYGISSEDYMKIVHQVRKEGVSLTDQGGTTALMQMYRASQKALGDDKRFDPSAKALEGIPTLSDRYKEVQRDTSNRFIEMLKRDADRGLLARNSSAGRASDSMYGTTEDLVKHGELFIKDGKLVPKQPGASKIIQPGQLQFISPYDATNWKDGDPTTNWDGTKKSDKQLYYDSLIHPSVRDLNNNFGVAMDFKDPSKMSPAERKADEDRTKKIMDATIKLQELSEQTNKSVQQLVQEMREGSLAAPGGDTLVTGGNTAVTVNNSDGAAAINNSNSISKDSIYRPK